MPELQRSGENIVVSEAAAREFFEAITGVLQALPRTDLRLVYLRSTTQEGVPVSFSGAWEP